MIVGWTCLRLLPGWSTRPASRPARTGSWLELGGQLLADGVPLAGGALTLAVPHPIIARRTWLWRAETGAVIEALGFVVGGPLGEAGRDWLARLGPVQEDSARAGAERPLLAWAGTAVRSATRPAGCARPRVSPRRRWRPRPRGWR